MKCYFSSNTEEVAQSVIVTGNLKSKLGNVQSTTYARRRQTQNLWIGQKPK